MKILTIPLIMCVLSEVKSTKSRSLRVEPSMQTVLQGLVAQVECIVDDFDPSVQVEWMKDGRRDLGLRTQIIGRTLKIPDVKDSDAGEYVCLVKDGMTRYQAVAWIKVRPRGIPILEVYPRDSVTVKWGGSVTLVCRTSPDYPNLVVYWTRKDGRPFTQNIVPSANGSLTITDADILNEGLYECTSTNEVGSASAIAQINVVSPPLLRITPDYNNDGIIFVKSGEHVKLFCEADGYPQPRMTWRKFSPGSGAFQVIAPLSYNTAVYEIKSMSEKDVQYYSCEGKNSAGTDTAAFRVEIDYSHTTISGRKV